MSDLRRQSAQREFVEVWLLFAWHRVQVACGSFATLVTRAQCDILEDGHDMHHCVG